MIYIKRLSLIGLLWSLIASVYGQSDRHPPVWRVIRVIDGDTFEAKRFKQYVRFRMIGIDTPEIHHDGTATDSVAIEAKQYLHQLIYDKPVWIVYDVQRQDQYGRDLVYVFSPNQKIHYNLEMIKAGLAMPLTIPPNVMYADSIYRLYQQVREEERGLVSKKLRP